MNIVGLDLSLTATGVAYADGSLRTLTSKATGMERLVWIRDGILTETIQSTTPGGGFIWVDLVVIEGYSFGSHDAGARSIGELGGVVRLALYENGIPYVDVPPSSLKKYATGSGVAKKSDMLLAAVRRFGYEGSSNDEADAAWLRLMALDAYGDPRALAMPAANRKALEVIEWPEIKETVDGH